MSLRKAGCTKGWAGDRRDAIGREITSAYLIYRGSAFLAHDETF